MVYKLISAHDTNREQYFNHVEQWGGFNDFPPGWREIDSAEFAKTICHHTPSLVEYRQMQNRHEDHLVSAVFAQLMFFDNNTGVAVESQYGPSAPALYSEYKYTARFYAFGCNHVYEGIDQKTLNTIKGFERHTLFRTMRAHRCTLCGHIRITDSSD